MKLFVVMLFVPIGWQIHLSTNNVNYKTARAIQYTINRAIDTLDEPSVFLETAIVDEMDLLTIRDTANAMTDISSVMNKDYTELFAFLNQKGLKPKKLMAIYYSFHTPVVLDVAIEVEKFPDQTAGRVKLNKIKSGNAVIAHYQGPYEQMQIAYSTLNNWLKQQNKIASGPPFEVYVNDPASLTNPFELRTDVYQFFR